MIELAIRIADEVTAACPDILDFASTQGPGRPPMMVRRQLADGSLGPPEPLEPFIFLPDEMDALYDARRQNAEEAERVFSAMGAVKPPVPEFLRKPEGD